MKAFNIIENGKGLESWKRVELPDPTPGLGQVLIRVKAVSLNPRDLMIISGSYRVIATTSSQVKTERLRSLGVSDIINYKETPNWQQEVLRLTNGLGVDQVIEVGGTGTLPKSLESVRSGGFVTLVGLLTGFADPINISPILFKAVRLQGAGVGSIQMAEAMTHTITARKLKPVIAEIFGFEAAKDALAKLQDAERFGKIVIRIDKKNGRFKAAKDYKSKAIIFSAISKL